MNDQKKDALLQQWKVDATLPATFNSAVWRRIEQLPPSPAKLLAQWLAGLFARPAVAFSYAALSLGIGLVAGQLHASNDLRKHQSQLEARYLQTIDPYAPRALQ